MARPLGLIVGVSAAIVLGLAGLLVVAFERCVRAGMESA